MNLSSRPAPRELLCRLILTIILEEVEFDVVPGCICRTVSRTFHHYHQALGPDFGCAGKPIADSWKEVPQQEKGRMVAAARLTLLELDCAYSENENPIRYFAPPGEAEWGC